MPQTRTTLGTAGAAVLLVLAAFSAGAATGPADAPAQVQLDAPDPDDRDGVSAVSDASPNAVPGLGAAELLYVPITPCRIIDSRNGTGAGGTPLGNGTTRSYYVGGTSGFAAQGGKSSGCGVPTTAMAAAVTIMAFEPSRNGRLKAWPAGKAEPSAATMYYQGVTSTTGSTLSLRPGAGTDVTFRNFTATTDLIVDVTGYYVPQLYAYVSSAGTVLDQSGRVVSVTKTGTGTYTVVWDRDISSCAGVASSDLSGYIQSVYTSGTSSYIYVYNNAGAASDYWFNVSIHC